MLPFHNKAYSPKMPANCLRVPLAVGQKIFKNWVAQRSLRGLGVACMGVFSLPLPLHFHCTVMTNLGGVSRRKLMDVSVILWLRLVFAFMAVLAVALCVIPTLIRKLKMPPPAVFSKNRVAHPRLWNMDELEIPSEPDAFAKVAQWRRQQREKRLKELGELSREQTAQVVRAWLRNS